MNLIRVGNRIINMDQVQSIQWVEDEKPNVRVCFSTESWIILYGLEARTFWKFLQNKLSEVKV